MADITYRPGWYENAGLTIQGVVIRLYEGGPEIHANTAHVNVGIESVEIVGKYLRVHHKTLPVVAIVTQADETLAGLRGIMCGPSGGVGHTNVAFYDTRIGRALDLSRASDYARVAGSGSNLWFQVTAFDERGI